ncbi:hypothetical protein VOLCADRAFT_99583 [Volvox carteri f. nagariensis]|uniref:GHMP kinase N-terminal domain-containing protein n=1 Tax=Volvox carteri f. nagariensis TaxID=3068 RepID=D8UI40_VOLCA|nr:uncharacterized protein VOLCADRAFT_99583 [Volvox carteri f. nagariensis]EFJ40607.1 hypothetical protein VOLCADRAFT_99583 [Volvox carteri f. nagariensis]|eukprot:XP_002958314.1 hypothetical protein VOLCADRAFT_99583 [Volvox carteri f. nagariensis]
MVVEDSVELFVSGRLCLFGEHTDWAGEYNGRSESFVEGRTIVVGTQEGIFATARPLKEKVLRITTTDNDGKQTGPLELPLEPAELLAVARAGGFFSYVAGTAYRVCVSYDLYGGLELINHATTLPMSKGLSSSAAICVMVARAFNRVYQLHLSTRGEMELAYLGEITTPSKCGRMDQACAYGSIPVLMTFDGDILTVDRVPLSAPLHLVLVDLGAHKDTTTILRCLQRAYQQPTSELHSGLHGLLGPINLRLTGAALRAMEEGDLPQLGRLMVEAQSLFDQLAGPLCPEQLSAPALHKVLSYPPIQDLVWGGKGVGSQGDGTAQLLCRGADAQAKVCAILSSELGLGCMPLSVAANITTSSTSSSSRAPMAASDAGVAVDSGK